MSKQEPAKTENKTEQKEEAFFKHDLNNEEIWAGTYKMKINPNGHLPTIADAILKHVEEFENFVATGPSGSQKVKVNRETTKKILELGLVGFNYEEARKAVGDGVLEKVSDFLFVYHVENGGKEGFRLWQISQSMAMMRISSGSQT